LEVNAAQKRFKRNGRAAALLALVLIGGLLLALGFMAQHEFQNGLRDEVRALDPVGLPDPFQAVEKFGAESHTDLLSVGGLCGLGHRGEHVLRVYPEPAKITGESPGKTSTWDVNRCKTIASGRAGSRESCLSPRQFGARFIMQSVLENPARTPAEESEWRRLHCGDFKNYPQRGDWPRRTLHRVVGWNVDRRCEVTIGFLVTSNWSDRLPGVLAAWPRPIAFVHGVSRLSLALASMIDRGDAIDGVKQRWPYYATMIVSGEQLADAVCGMILVPARRDGSAISTNRRAFPVATYARWTNAAGKELMVWQSLTQHAYATLSDKKSGRSETLNAAHLGGQSSNRKGIVTAA
jgi:hypothetical protein